MRGMVDSCGKNRPGYFFIIGDDGIRYFGHRHQCVDTRNYKTYGYKGNTLTFDPADPPKEGALPTANNIVFDKNDKIEMVKRKQEEEYRDWLIEMFHKYGHDELIALICPYGEEAMVKEMLELMEEKDKKIEELEERIAIMMEGNGYVKGEACDYATAVCDSEIHAGQRSEHDGNSEDAADQPGDDQQDQGS